MNVLPYEVLNIIAQYSEDYLYVNLLDEEEEKGVDDTGSLVFGPEGKLNLRWSGSGIHMYSQHANYLLYIKKYAKKLSIIDWCIIAANKHAIDVIRDNLEFIKENKIWFWLCSNEKAADIILTHFDFLDHVDKGNFLRQEWSYRYIEDYLPDMVLDNHNLQVIASNEAYMPYIRSRSRFFVENLIDDLCFNPGAVEILQSEGVDISSLSYQNLSNICNYSKDILSVISNYPCKFGAWIKDGIDFGYEYHYHLCHNPSAIDFISKHIDMLTKRCINVLCSKAWAAGLLLDLDSKGLLRKKHIKSLCSNESKESIMIVKKKMETSTLDSRCWSELCKNKSSHAVELVACNVHKLNDTNLHFLNQNPVAIDFMLENKQLINSSILNNAGLFETNKSTIYSILKRL
jgi:hypothetical protein